MLSASHTLITRSLVLLLLYEPKSALLSASHNTRESFSFNESRSQHDTDNPICWRVCLRNYWVMKTIETLPSATFPGTLPSINLSLPLRLVQLSLLPRNFVEVWHKAGILQIVLAMSLYCHKTVKEAYLIRNVINQQKMLPVLCFGFHFISAFDVVY